MSLENAILELAAAIRELAGAILKAAGAGNALLTSNLSPESKGVRGSTTEEAAADYIPGKKDRGTGPATKNDASGAAESADTSAGAPSEDAKAKAIREAKEAAAAHAEKSTTPAPDPVPADDKPLDYMKEVVPVMNEAVKADRPAVIALLATFGAKKGAEVPAAQHRVLLAGCQKIIAEAKAA